MGSPYHTGPFCVKTHTKINQYIFLTVGSCVAWDSCPRGSCLDFFFFFDDFERKEAVGGGICGGAGHRGISLRLSC